MIELLKYNFSREKWQELRCVSRLLRKSPDPTETKSKQKVFAFKSNFHENSAFPVFLRLWSMKLLNNVLLEQLVNILIDAVELHLDIMVWYALNDLFYILLKYNLVLYDRAREISISFYYYILRNYKFVFNHRK